MLADIVIRRGFYTGDQPRAPLTLSSNLHRRSRGRTTPVTQMRCVVRHNDHMLRLSQVHVTHSLREVASLSPRLKYFRFWARGLC